MPTTDQKIPNNPLNGAELKAVCLTHVRDLMQLTEAALIAAIEERMSRDGLFAVSPYTHPRAQVKIRFEFVWSNKNLPTTAFTVNVGAAPLEDAAGVFVAGVNREISIDSPNLERIAAGIPITHTEAVKPKPGEMFGSFVQTEIPVNPEEYPKPKTPVDEDISEFVAEDLKIPEAKRLRGPKKQRGAK